MELKSAVQAAKAYLADIYADERISGIGLEEVDFDNRDDVWRITLGFDRRLPHGRIDAAIMEQMGIGVRRIYKVITVNQEGAVRSMKNREVAE